MRRSGMVKMITVALADLRHERTLALCLLAALTAIIAPLLILQGLRHGSVETMRERLIDNPTFTEIWPVSTHTIAPDWFETVGAREDVAFLLPTTLLGLSAVTAAPLDESAAARSVDMRPTAPGDPILGKAGIADPGAGEVAITESMRAAFDLQTGDRILLTIGRGADTGMESVPSVQRVIGVVPFDYDGLPRLYAPLPFLRAVSRYRRGLAVPELGWPGGRSLPDLRYDGAILLADPPLSPEQMLVLRTGSGIAHMRVVPPEEVERLIARRPDAGVTAHLLTPRGRGLFANSIRSLNDELRGRRARIIPYVEPGLIRFRSEIRVLVGQPPDPGVEAFLMREAGAPVPGLTYDGTGSIPLVGQGDVATISDIEQASLNLGESWIDAEVSFVQGDPSGTMYASMNALALLNQPAENLVEYDEVQGSFAAKASTAKGFRLYARSIDDTPELFRELIASGMDVDARIEEIERVRALGDGLTRLFLVIAAVGVVGGGGALLASLHAAVLRKRRDLAILRLIGFSRRDTALFPAVQSIAIGLGGFALSLLTYAIAATIINGQLGGAIQGQEGGLCRLPLAHIGLAGVGILAIAIVSAALAGRAATAIEPAEGLR